MCAVVGPPVPLGFPTLACTRRRFGRWMLLVLMLEWLTLLATRRCLPQTAHCAGITFSSGRRVRLASTDEIRKPAPGLARGGAARARAGGRRVGLPAPRSPPGTRALGRA